MTKTTCDLCGKRIIGMWNQIDLTAQPRMETSGRYTKGYDHKAKTLCDNCFIEAWNRVNTVFIEDDET